MERWRGPLVAGLVAALVTHFAAMFLLPSLVMAEIMRRTVAEGGVNQMVFAAQPDAQWRTIVRPSPDVLYAICAYDLGAGPVLVTAPKVPGTYTSIALYADNTDNFYVVNDTQPVGAGLAVTIALPGQLVAGEAPVTLSPSARGLVLFRVLVGSDPALAAAAEARRDARCAPAG